MTLDPLAQIAVLEEAIIKLANVNKSLLYSDKSQSDIVFTIGLLEAMKKMLEKTI